MKNVINLEKQKVLELQELEGKHILQAFVADNKVYLDMGDEGVYLLEGFNLRFLKGASTPINGIGEVITNVEIKNDSRFNEFRVLIECQTYSALVIYQILDPSTVVSLRAKETGFRMIDFQLATLQDKMKSLIEELNEKLAGKNIRKVLQNNISNSAYLVTDEKVIEIVRDSGLSYDDINFNLKGLEGKCIESIDCEIQSMESIICKITSKDLKSDISTEIPNTIWMKNPNVAKSLLMISESSYYRVNYSESFKFSDIIGETIVDIIGGEGDGELTLRMANGYDIVLYHEQDCCEYVYLYDVAGNLEDLIGSPLVQAEESTSDGGEDEDCCESRTWTFYKFATAKGYVTLRWLGESNGYYSESVDIRIEPSIYDEDETNKKVYLQ